MLAGGDAAEAIGFGIGPVHVFVQLALPRFFIPLAAHDAQVHIAVARVAEADHLHAALGFQVVDEADEVRRAADGHDDIDRLLLGNGLHGLDKRAAHAPDVSALPRVGELDKVERAVLQCQRAHARGIGRDLFASAVKGQENIRAGVGAGIRDAAEAFAKRDDFALHEFDRRGVRVRAQDGQNALDAGFQVGIRHKHAERGLGLGNKAQQALCDDGERTLRADEKVLERESARVLDLLAADLHHRAVSEHDLESAHIVARDAVLHRAHAAGVRADVAADARGLFAGIGRVEQPARFDIGLQVLQEHTGLDRDGHRVLVELEHAVHAGKVEDDAALERHGRADKIRPRAARRDGNAVLVRVAQERAHLLGG